MTYTELRGAFDKATSYIKRDGFPEFLTWLETETDYFTAPASGSQHGNFENGLLAHSLNVMKFALYNFNLILKQSPEQEFLRESVILVSLFHDICKCNTYTVGKKWAKDDQTNKWYEYKAYIYENTFPLGHGEKSLFMIAQKMEIKPVEALAIRFHMGNFEQGLNIPGMGKSAYDEAFNHQLVGLISAADVLAAITEEKINYKNIKL